MEFLYIYLVIHLFCFVILLFMHGAFLQPYLSQINQTDTSEIFHQRIHHIARSDHFSLMQCQASKNVLVVETSQKIYALTPEKRSSKSSTKTIKMAIEIRSIEDHEGYTNEKAQKYANILNQNLTNFYFEKPVCIQELKQFPKELIHQSQAIEYFNLTLTQEQKVPIQKEGLFKAFLIDFIFAPLILIAAIFLKMIGFHVP